MRLIINKLRSNSFFKGGAFLIFSSFFGSFLNYLYSSTTGRALGPAGYGEIATMLSYLMLLTFPLGVLSALLIKKIGKHEQSNVYILSLLTWSHKKIRKWWLILLLPVICLPFIPSLTNLSLLTSVTLVFLVYVTVISDLYDAILQGKHLLISFAISSLISVFIKLCGGALALFVYPIIFFPLIAILLSNIIRVVINHSVIYKELETQKEIIKINKRIIHIFRDKQFWLTFFSSAGLLLLSNIDIIYVKRVFSAEDAGLYSAWSLFAKIVLYAVGPFISLSFIFFTSEKFKKYHKFTLTLCIITLSFAGFMMAIIYNMFPQLLIKLVFGAKFYSLIPYLGLASYFGIGYVFITFFNNYYLATGSKVVFVLPILTVPYILTIITQSKSIYQVMTINISYGIVAVVCYFVFYLLSCIKSQ